jgi:hypothetical protein
MAPRFACSLLAALAAVLICCASAGARDCNAPPGTAAIDQYCETLPSATGTNGGEGGDVRRVSAATRAALRQSGDDGRALSRLLAETPARTHDQPATRSSGTSNNPARADESATNALGAVRSAIGSGDTVGAWLPWLLLVLAILLGGIAWFRSHRRRAS